MSMAFNEESGYYIANHGNGYAIFSYETEEMVFFHENFRKVLTKKNKLMKKVK